MRFYDHAWLFLVYYFNSKKLRVDSLIMQLKLWFIWKPCNIIYLWNDISKHASVSYLASGLESRTQGLKPRTHTQEKIQVSGQGPTFRGQTLSRLRTGILEAKDTKRKCFPKKRSLRKNIANFPRNSGVLQKKSLHKFSARSLAKKKDDHDPGPFSTNRKNSAVRGQSIFEDF